MKLFPPNQPTNMNFNKNKIKCAEYVQRINELLRDGKQTVYIDETNFNLFFRKIKGRLRIGSRAVQILPACRGPNIHVIGAIYCNGIVKFAKKRGFFNAIKMDKICF